MSGPGTRLGIDPGAPATRRAQERAARLHPHPPGDAMSGPGARLGIDPGAPATRPAQDTRPDATHTHRGTR
ncbi:hypothetical protein [Actinomadura flavalba]|uniref:hypothetical protein n=1 Tax=Actinomadura flavalba TaxID=1120938 RepID=UPI00037E6BFE|nr:hypothetical protein [Actinomadura flavalba]